MLDMSYVRKYKKGEKKVVNCEHGEYITKTNGLCIKMP